MAVIRQSGLNYRSYSRWRPKRPPAIEIAAVVKPLARIESDLAEVRESIETMREELANGLNEQVKAHYQRMIKQLDEQRKFLLAQRQRWKGEEVA